MGARNIPNKPAVNRTAPRLSVARIFLAAFVWLLVSGAKADPVVNPPSAWPVTVDGQFSGGLDGRGTPVGEWSDVTPQAFITRTTDGTLLRTTRDDSRKTSLLWAAVSPPADGAPGALKLHLLYEAHHDPARVRARRGARGPHVSASHRRLHPARHSSP